MERLALEARRLGFDSLWFHDHLLTPAELGHLSPASVYDPLIAMARMAALAPELTVGVAALVTPLREPVALAKQLATLEAFFPGRIIAGLVPGRYQSEFEAFGSPWFARRGEVADESIRLMRALFQGGRVTFEGQYRFVREAIFDPKPASPGRPPLWIGGNTVRAVRRAAELGDGWVPGGLSPEAVRSGRDQLVTHLEAARRDPAEFQIGLSLTIDPSIDTEAERLDAHAQGSHAHAQAVFGGAQEIGEQLLEYVAAGVSHFILAFWAGSVEQLLERLAWFSAEVAPVVQAGAERSI